MDPTDQLARPSRFWEELGGVHSGDLDRHGLAAIKRHQALRYFTWSWRWRSLHRSEQMRFLLTHTPPRTLARCLSARSDLSTAAWDGVAWKRHDRWLYTFATRLLWEYAQRQDTLGVLSLPEPEIGGPLPVSWQGRLISQDLANTSLEAAAVARALGGIEPRTIVEVGAGYGRTAYALLNAFPRSTYTIVDIEPALTISRWYLTQLFPASRLKFVPASSADTLEDESADLVLSISSLHEMTHAQLDMYLGLFDRIGGGGVVYLKQWQRWTNPADGITLAFDQYPIPPAWQQLFSERAPVQTRFRHAAWRVSSDRRTAP